jgi:hypothetical protein
LSPNDFANSLSLKSQLGFSLDAFDALDKGIWDVNGLSLTLDNRNLILRGSGSLSTREYSEYEGPFEIGVSIQAEGSGAQGGVFGLEFRGGESFCLVVDNIPPTRVQTYYFRSNYSYYYRYEYLSGRPFVQCRATRDASNRLTLRYRAEGAVNWSVALTATAAAPLQTLRLGGISGFFHSVFARYKNLVASPYHPSGYWTSRTLDLGRTPTVPGYLRWRQALPLGTRLDIQTSSSDDGLAWSRWSPPYQDDRGERIVSPPARYLKVAASLYANADLTQSPVLSSLSVEYPEAAPLAPEIQSSTHPHGRWSPQATAHFVWSLPPQSPAPEASYTYWLRHNGVLTGTATRTLDEPAGKAHSLVLELPGEGSYSLDLQVRGDEPSGSLTASARTYEFGYDATPPGQTSIHSPTHPELLFSNNRNPVFNLSATDALSGLSGFAAVLDRASTGDPGDRVNAGSELRYSALDNGTWYLHARAIDLAGNLGPVTHYGIRIDYNGDLLSLEHVKVLPNPVRGDTARLVYELAAPATEVKLEFRNSQGELLKSMDGGRAVGANEVRWDVSSLANGVYFFSVSARSADDGRRFKVTRKLAVLR